MSSYNTIPQRFRNPSGMGSPKIEEFLTHLAVKRQVSASTQNQALNALVFLFKHILGKESGEFEAVRAKQRRCLPMGLVTDDRNVLT